MDKQVVLHNLLAGNRNAIARTISLIENDNSDAGPVMDALYAKVGRAYRIGITGPPGAGKSTIVDGLTKYYRQQGRTVGIIAVDPTSPFTGGALLGDRIRMGDLTLDEGVFIRSMATRGSLGGLSKKASDAADVLDAAGKDFVILETVGVGQSELEIVEAADTTVVVLVPESGDAIQTMKAGLMEIASLFVLNKADREGADRAVQEIQAMLHMRAGNGWEPVVLKTVASKGEGITELAAAIERHRNNLIDKNLLEKNRSSRLLKKIYTIVRYRLEKAFWDDSTQKTLQGHLQHFENSKMSPYKIADQLLLNFKRKMEKTHE